jgi:hypothetical protein
MCQKGSRSEMAFMPSSFSNSDSAFLFLFDFGCFCLFSSLLYVAAGVIAGGLLHCKGIPKIGETLQFTAILPEFVSNRK